MTGVVVVVVDGVVVDVAGVVVVPGVVVEGVVVVGVVLVAAVLQQHKKPRWNLEVRQCLSIRIKEKELGKEKLSTREDKSRI